MEITIQDVREFLEANKESSEVQEVLRVYVPDKPVTPDMVNSYLGTEEGKRLVQPMMDKRVTEALETFKKKTFESEVSSRVAAELLKRNPEETAEQKRIRELEQNMKRSEEERQAEKLKSQIKDMAFKEGVPLDFIDEIPFASPEHAALYMRRFKQQITDAQTAKVNELLANGFKPGTGNPKDSSGKKDISKLSQEELVKLELEGKLDEYIS